MPKIDQPNRVNWVCVKDEESGWYSAWCDELNVTAAGATPADLLRDIEDVTTSVLRDRSDIEPGLR